MDKSIKFNMYYKQSMLKKIDELKESLGFIHRAQTILYLINLGMQKHKENNK